MTVSLILTINIKLVALKSRPIQATSFASVSLAFLIIPSYLKLRAFFKEDLIAD